MVATVSKQQCCSIICMAGRQFCSSKTVLDALHFIVLTVNVCLVDDEFVEQALAKARHTGELKV